MVLTNNCYYCDGTGWVPWVEDPNIKNNVYHIMNMACKCSRGKRMAKPTKRWYGDNNPIRTKSYPFKDDGLQFMDGEEGLSYPQVATNKKNEMNVKLNKERENEKTRA